MKAEYRHPEQMKERERGGGARTASFTSTLQLHFVTCTYVEGGDSVREGMCV